MPEDNFDIWNGNTFNNPSGSSGKKPKKDPYANPLGMTETPSGITGETEDILRQSRETDRAIGEAAGQQKKPEPVVKIPEAPVIKSQPLPEPDNNTSRTRFQYGTKTYDVTPSEPDKKTRDYEDSLRIDSANEGYVIPPIPPSAGNSESYPDEKQKLDENAANEGFTIRDSESYRQAQAESEDNVKRLTGFLGQFMRGNERENRFANGIPAPGEKHFSILGNALDAKNESDNATQEDWANSIKDLQHSPVGQATLDIYHNGARGTYELGNSALSGAAIMDDHLKTPYQLVSNPFNFYPIWDTGQKTFSNTPIDTQYEIYKQKKELRTKAQEHEKFLSRDHQQASLEKPGYLGIKEAGNFVRNIPAMLTAGMIVEGMGAGYELAYATLAGSLDEYTGRYDSEMDKWMAKPEKDMWNYPEYVAAKRAGKSEEEARFRVADPRVKKGSLIALLTGAVKGAITHGIGKMTRDGTEGTFLKGIQDYSAGRFFEK